MTKALLAALAEGGADAGARYEALRRKLILFFTWERCLFPKSWPMRRWSAWPAGWQGASRSWTSAATCSASPA